MEKNIISNLDYSNTVAQLQEYKKINSDITVEDGSIKAILLNIIDFSLRLAGLEKKINEEYFKENTFEDLSKLNGELYEEVIGDSYNNSYANPSYAVKVLGEDLGQVISMLYAKLYINMIEWTFEHNTVRMANYNNLILDVAKYIDSVDKVESIKLKELITNHISKNTEVIENEKVRNMAYSDTHCMRVLNNSNTGDLRYLFKYGYYITDNHIKLAEFLNQYPQEDIDELARVYVEGFLNGAKRDNKNIWDKNLVEVRYAIGQERILQSAVKLFKENEFDCTAFNLEGAEANKQLTYDQKFDYALYLDEEYKELKGEMFKKALNTHKDGITNYAGPAVFLSFGETPFTPESKSENLKLSDAQSVLMREIMGSRSKTISEYIKPEERTFTIIALPSPEIGDKFEEIFEETRKVNMLDSDKYERIQQALIDTLDQGKYVRIKGAGNNKTDILVQMQDIQNPEKHTNFVNTVADVNIPVGEVFTTPKLSGTNGVLHVSEVYLDDIKYKDLKLTFGNGKIVDYMCRNFEVSTENKKFIEENLLFPHKTLPMGEFAIGTNTTAYAMANKYDIIGLLPILIVEKMGPHFAIGDTCFSREEDMTFINPFDGKEVTAKDNEVSILREHDESKAYTQVHTDITIPYDEIEFISVVGRNGEKTDIIRKGKFVLEGTEELNDALEN